MLQHAETASALSSGEYDVTFLGPFLHDWVRVPALGSSALRTVIARRRLRDLNRQQVVSLWPAELADRGLALTGRPGASVGRAILTAGFDLAALVRLKDTDVFHFHSGLCVRSPRAARERGALVICDERGPHVLAHRRTIVEEHLRLGVDVPPSDQFYQRRSLHGYEAADIVVVASEYARQTFVAEGYPA